MIVVGLSATASLMRFTAGLDNPECAVVAGFVSPTTSALQAALPGCEPRRRIEENPMMLHPATLVVTVVLAGLVDDSHVAFAIGFAIGEHLANLACFEILHASVFHTRRERTRCLLNSHARE
jgi:hypothetical protein